MSTPRATSTRRSAARATRPLWDSNGARRRRARRAPRRRRPAPGPRCARTAADPGRAAGRRCRRRAGARGRRRRRPRPWRPACAAGRAPAAVPGARVGTSPSSSVLRRTADRSTGPPAPARSSSRVLSEPSSTALACAPRSSDSAVRSGVVRLSPRSRSRASMPSRVAAIADADPLEGRQPGERVGVVGHGAQASRGAVSRRLRPRDPWRGRRRPRSSPRAARRASRPRAGRPAARTSPAPRSATGRRPASTRVSSTWRWGWRSRVITGAETCVNSSVRSPTVDLPGHLAVEAVLGLARDLHPLLAGVLPEGLGASGAGLLELGCSGSSGRSTSATVSATMTSSRSTVTVSGRVLPVLGHPPGEPAADPVLLLVCNHVIDITPVTGRTSQARW